MRADLLFELCGKLFRHARREARLLEVAVKRTAIGAVLDMVPDGPMDDHGKCIHGARRIELIACDHGG
jgi:hypothetical protein